MQIKSECISNEIYTARLAGLKANIPPVFEPEHPHSEALAGGFIQDNKSNRRKDDQTLEDSSRKAANVADKYANRHGFSKPFLIYGYKAPVELLKELADYLEDTAHTPNNPEVLDSYRKMLDEVLAQGIEIVNNGLNVEAWPENGEPYTDSLHMRQDVAKNNHLYFLPTETAFGENGPFSNVQDEYKNTPLVKPSGLVRHGYELNKNEVLRFVHDYFGHVATENKFNLQEEFNALLTHLQMFSPEARKAVLSEIFMQTAWYFAGRHMRRTDGSIPKRGESDFVSFKDRKFANPKAIVPSDSLLKKVMAEMDKAVKEGMVRSFMPKG